MKKIIAAVVLAVIGVFVVPAAANAAGYVPSANVSVTGAVTPGGTADVDFAAGSFVPNESISFAVTGPGRATLSAAAATVNLTKNADSSGAATVDVKLPADATGTFSLTATGAVSQNIATATLTIAPADVAPGGGASSSGLLAFTGSTGSMLLLWSAGGVIVLGLALLVVLMLVRRQRATP